MVHEHTGKYGMNIVVSPWSNQVTFDATTTSIIMSKQHIIITHHILNNLDQLLDADLHLYLY